MVEIDFKKLSERAKEISEIYGVEFGICQIILLSGYTLCQDDLLSSTIREFKDLKELS